MKRLAAIGVVAAVLTGCAGQPINTVSLTVSSQPAGAYITPIGEPNGSLATLTRTWKLSEMSRYKKDSQGCHLVPGYAAKWGSGAFTASSDYVTICGGAGYYTIVLNRDTSHPGLDRDLEFALKVERHQQHQQQQQAAAVAREDARTDAIIEGLAAGFAGAMDARAARQPVQIAPIRCTSKRSISGTVTTDCN